MTGSQTTYSVPGLLTKDLWSIAMLTSQYLLQVLPFKSNIKSKWNKKPEENNKILYNHD